MIRVRPATRLRPPGQTAAVAIVPGEQGLGIGAGGVSGDGPCGGGAGGGQWHAAKVAVQACDDKGPRSAS